MNSRFPMPEAKPQGVINPASANVCMEWVRDMGKIGFTVVAVEGRSWADALQNNEAGFEEKIGEQLTEARLGHFDSLLTGAPFTLFFYLFTDTLPTGLQFIQGKLESLGLLHLCKIAQADSEEKCWRTFYPAIAEQAP
jgi:hypothetical protein